MDAVAAVDKATLLTNVEKQADRDTWLASGSSRFEPPSGAPASGSVSIGIVMYDKAAAPVAAQQPGAKYNLD